MRAVLIEDEVPALEHLEALLGRVRPQAEVVARLRTVKAVRAWFAEGAGCDLVIADIELGDGTSLEALREVELGVPVVFATAHDDFRAEALERNGVAYLLKPVREAALAAALDRLDRLEQHFVGSLRELVQRLEQAPSRLVGRRGVDWVGVPVADVRWIRVRNGVTTATTADGAEIMLEEPLNRLQAMLDPTRFFRASRWYLVSLEAVARVRSVGRGRLGLVLDPPAGEDVEVTQQHAGAFRAWFGMPGR